MGFNATSNNACNVVEQTAIGYIRRDRTKAQNGAKVKMKTDANPGMAIIVLEKCSGFN